MREKLAVAASRFIFGLYLFLAAVIFWGVFIAPSSYTQQLYDTLLFLILGVLSILGLIALYKRCTIITDFLKRVPEGVVVLTLAILCVTVKLIWVLTVRIDPRVDYYTFYHAAEQLSGNFTIPDQGYLPNYLALFPHIFGYASFLSAFFAVFGASPMVASLVNVILTLFSMLFLYYICKKLVSTLAAVVASAIWIFFPSQTIYNMFVLSEPYYTMLLLFATALAVYMQDKTGKMSYCRWILLSVAVGIALGIANTARPVSAIVVIALFIWVLLVKPIDTPKKFHIQNAVFILVICLVVVLTGSINDAVFALRIGKEPAAYPGYNILVGFNQNSNGRWNQGDSDLLTHYMGLFETASEVQQQMWGEAIQRITSGDIRFAELFYNKHLILWGSDSAAVGYASETIGRPFLMRVLSDSYYFVIVFFGAIGAAIAFIKKVKSMVCVVALYFIGLTLAHMLVEVAGRYHYSGIPDFIVMAAYAIDAFIKRKAGGKATQNSSIQLMS